MITLISVLMIAVSILLILVVLMQNAKGGGFTTSFSSFNQMAGVRKTTDFLEKATWGLAITLVALCIISTTITQSSTKVVKESALKNAVSTENIQIPTGASTIQTTEDAASEETTEAE